MINFSEWRKTGKYTFKERVYKESRNSSESGWKKYDEYWIKEKNATKKGLYQNIKSRCFRYSPFYLIINIRTAMLSIKPFQ